MTFEEYAKQEGYDLNPLTDARIVQRLWEQFQLQNQAATLLN